MSPPTLSEIRETLLKGMVIPAHPLALNQSRKLDERRQRALSRYYLAAGAGGLAVGVHTTQFAIRDPDIGLYRPVLELAVEEMGCAKNHGTRPIVRVAGLCGDTKQAAREAELARELDYHVGLLSLGGLNEWSDEALIGHCQAVAAIIPIFGFYLQPAAGGRVLSHGFWRAFVEIENVVAVKIAPFNRYQTIDVVRAVAESKRHDIALYTGNDDNIIMDLLTPFPFHVDGEVREYHIVGGLLGQWAVWTCDAVSTLRACRELARDYKPIPMEMMRRHTMITDANAALFDSANGFRGCIAGIHEILRRQGLLEGIWCLDPSETLSPGQQAEIERVCRAYPELTDDAFVEEHLDAWLNG